MLTSLREFLVNKTNKMTAHICSSSDTHMYHLMDFLNESLVNFTLSVSKLKCMKMDEMWQRDRDV